MGMAAILINKLWRFVQILTPFNRRVHAKFKENQHRVLEEKSFKVGIAKGRTDVWTDDGWQAITIVLPPGYTKGDKQ